MRSAENKQENGHEIDQETANDFAEIGSTGVRTASERNGKITMPHLSHAREFDVVGDELALIYVRRSRPYPKKKKQDQLLEGENFDKLSREEASIEVKMPSIETQIASCQKMAEVKHVQVAGIYTDIRTGTILSRKGLDALRARIKSQVLPRIKYIFVHAVDRLSRGDQADQYLLEKEF